MGADLANAINDAALRAAREGTYAVGVVDFDEAIDRVVAGAERRSRVMSAREKGIVAYHEAGHALVGRGPAARGPVAKISIIPRALFLDVGVDPPRKYSEETARAIDVEIRRLLEESHSRVRSTLESRRPELEALALLLIQQEVVDGKSLLALLADHGSVPEPAAGTKLDGAARDVVCGRPVDEARACASAQQKGAFGVPSC